MATHSYHASQPLHTQCRRGGRPGRRQNIWAPAHPRPCRRVQFVVCKFTVCLCSLQYAQAPVVYRVECVVYSALVQFTVCTSSCSLQGRVCSIQCACVVDQCSCVVYRVRCAVYVQCAVISLYCAECRLGVVEVYRVLNGQYVVCILHCTIAVFSLQNAVAVLSVKIAVGVCSSCLCELGAS